MDEKWNHFDEAGNAVMVDVSEKAVTVRTASAAGAIRVNAEVMDAVVHGNVKKGDVLGVARVAGIMAAKQVWSLIPMCHPLCIRKCAVDFETDEEKLEIRAISTVKVEEKTGVEMPICRCVYEILYRQRPVQEVARELMGRARKGEIEDGWRYPVG